MTIKKKLLTLFYLTLVDTKINNLADARMRDALATKALFSNLKDFEEARKKIFEEFAKKDEKGNPIVVGDQYKFDGEMLKKMQDEVKILEEEEVDFEVKKPEKIRQFIENTKYEPKVGEMELIDEIIKLLNESK